MSRSPFSDGWSYRSPAGPFAPASGAVGTSTPVRLPHDALRDADRRRDAPGGGAGAFFPPGAYAYEKDFDVPADWEGRIIRLEVQGAYRRAQIFVNDEFAGNRADGYARFFVDLTPFLRFGERNTVRIEVRSGEDARWYSGAGLHRPVFLHVDRLVHVVPDGVTTRTIRVEDDQAVVEVAVDLTNAGPVTRTVLVSTTVTDPQGTVADADTQPCTLAPRDRTVIRHRLYLPDAQLWSPDHPAMHTASVRLDEDDDVQVPFGVREVTVDPRKGLRINGEPVLLRGACIHSDNGPLGAAAIGRADERRIELLKEAGFNAIRAAHNPASPALLDACDRLGMLVMDEAFDMWTRFKTPGDYAAEFPQWWAADLEAMVVKDRNHPSVILYSLGNEIVEVGTPHGARWARRMAELVRAFDPTRLVTNGINPFLAVIDEIPALIAAAGGGLNQAMSTDSGAGTLAASDAVSRRIAESSAPLDVLGLNYAESRYALDREQMPHRVIVGSETFPMLIGDLWPAVLENPNVIGDFTWTGWDYLGEVGIGAVAYENDPDAAPGLEREYPFLTAWCGDIDITGHRRPASYYREIVFGLRSAPYIAVRRPAHHGDSIAFQSPWAWTDSVSSWTWPGYEDQTVTVDVYADAEEVALLLGESEVARATVGVTRPMLASIETPYRPGRLTAVAYRDGTETGRISLDTAGATARLSARVDRSTLQDDDDDLAFVAIELHDEAGRLVTPDERSVTVEVTGAAVLAGMCSANPKTTERFDSATWATFDGRAIAVVRPAGAGPATVTVQADGLEPVTLPLHVSSSA